MEMETYRKALAATLIAVAERQEANADQAGADRYSALAFRTQAVTCLLIAELVMATEDYRDFPGYVKLD